MVQKNPIPRNDADGSIPELKGMVPETPEGVQALLDAMAEEADKEKLAKTKADAAATTQRTPTPIDWRRERLSILPWKRRAQKAALMELKRGGNPVRETALVDLTMLRGLKSADDWENYRRALEILPQRHWAGFTDTAAKCLKKFRDDPDRLHPELVDDKAVTGSYDYQRVAERYLRTARLLSDGGSERAVRESAAKLLKAGGLKTQDEWDELNDSLEAMRPELRAPYLGKALPSVISHMGRSFAADERLKPREGDYLRAARLVSAMAEAVPSPEGRAHLISKSVPRMLDTVVITSLKGIEDFNGSLPELAHPGWGAHIPDYAQLIPPALMEYGARFTDPREFRQTAGNYARFLEAAGADREAPARALAEGLIEWIFKHERGEPIPQQSWDRLHMGLREETARLAAEKTNPEEPDRIKKLAEYLRDAGA